MESSKLKARDFNMLEHAAIAKARQFSQNGRAP